MTQPPGKQTILGWACCKRTVLVPRQGWLHAAHAVGTLDPAAVTEGSSLHWRLFGQAQSGEGHSGSDTSPSLHCEAVTPKTSGFQSCDLDPPGVILGR